MNNNGDSQTKLPPPPPPPKIGSFKSFFKLGFLLIFAFTVNKVAVEGGDEELSPEETAAAEAPGHEPAIWDSHLSFNPMAA